MLLTCEKCESQYNIPVEKIPEKGRTVRCTKCKHEWIEKPDGSQESPELVEKKEAIVEEEEQSPPPKAIVEATPEDVDIPPAHIITNNPLGVNDWVFGSLVFTLLMSLTFIFLCFFFLLDIVKLYYIVISCSTRIAGL